MLHSRGLAIVLIALAALVQAINCQQWGESRVRVKKELDSRANAEAGELDIEQIDGTTTATVGEPTSAEESKVPVEDLLPKNTNLFQKDAVDPIAIAHMDCHLRNVDYCFAGLMGIIVKVMPETDSELDTRCDEIKAAMGCLAAFNQRCSTFKVFAALAPFADLQRTMPSEVGGQGLAPVVDSLVMNRNVSGASYERATKIRVADLASICEPESRRTEANRLLRRRVFELSKCINQRLPGLMPCFGDLKTAIQVLYEPKGSLPLQPACCAVSRFRNCAVRVLDNICGLSSMDQLENMLANGGAGSMLVTVENVCRQGAKFDSPYCVDILPPAGMRVPQKRGKKTSKLLKALDLISIAPAAQPKEFEN